MSRRWRPGEVLGPNTVFNYILAGLPLYWRDKWYHPSFIQNWPVKMIINGATQKLFRRAYPTGTWIKGGDHAK